jgi:integrase
VGCLGRHTGRRRRWGAAARAFSPEEIATPTPDNRIIAWPYTKRMVANNTVNMALKRMGFDGRMCGHGLRALAMTNVQEQLGIDLRIADRQLAHIEKNKVTAAYNRAEYWPQRVSMMQRWADLLDQV